MKKITKEDASNSDKNLEDGDDGEQEEQEKTKNDPMMTSTKASNKRNADNKDDKLPQPSPNPKAKKKTKEDALINLEDESWHDQEQEETTNDNSSHQVVDLISPLIVKQYQELRYSGHSQLFLQQHNGKTPEWREK
jgi:hypothetical protein